MKYGHFKSRLDEFKKVIIGGTYKKGDVYTIAEVYGINPKTIKKKSKELKIFHFC